MSWLSPSSPTSFDYRDHGSLNDVAPLPSGPALPNGDGLYCRAGNGEHGHDDESSQSSGVKGDLKETLSRRLRGVASVLAPPPEPSDPSVSHSPDDDQPDGSVSGFGGDFEDISGRFKRMASNLMAIGSGEEEMEMEEKEMGAEDGRMINDEHCDDDDDYDFDLGFLEAVGLTEEVLSFAENISHHPETWLDFPLEAENDLDDLKMSEEQLKHAMVIELLTPRFAALRFELCPCHMNESYFWKVYFVLLHSRLNKHDAEILSTSQVLEARATWMQELHKGMKPEPDWYGNISYNEVEDDPDPHSPCNLHSQDVAYNSYADKQTIRTTSFKSTDYETEMHPVESADMKIIDKSIIEEQQPVKSNNKRSYIGQSTKILLQNYEDDDYEWPEEDSDLVGYSRTTIPLGKEDDISFSDLENDDDVGEILSKRSRTRMQNLYGGFSQT